MDLSFFVDRRVGSVCLSKNQMIIRFEGGVVLDSACMATIEVGGVTVASDLPRDLAGHAGQLIADVVSEVSSDVDGTLRLTFRSGAVLMLTDSGSPGYELRDRVRDHVDRGLEERPRQNGSCMYGFADDVDLSFFKGAVLEQVCLGAHQVILRFYSDVSVNSACWMALAVGDHRIESDDPRVLAPALMGLITETVVDVRWKSDGTLFLLFLNGGVMRIEDDAAPHYESYHIKHGKDLIVV
ncbi:hypothetical protein N866_19145 [Actinotalea ferrariae CF5-4]|uniref:Uncharacterized protein n=1 Tax=Actinotalea ferrariae CF5-4 TaxID=948458 RepID=A0A021VUD1_9CELL|nr:DUF6188 family protein [Actinotalea ferrariae]EYR63655.1 hypothetical protein N866_19145 [Actinotalea ferrariae CF5-4]